MSFNPSGQATPGRSEQRDAGVPGGWRWGRALVSATRDPLEGAERAWERLVELRPLRSRAGHSHPDPYWESALHALLLKPWPCDECDGFAPLWAESLALLGRQGVAVGRGAYCGWDDGDSGLARAAWSLTRHLQPRNVVETGVARGLTTSVVLQALQSNGPGCLFSIDLPPALDRREFVDQTGAAVPDRLKPRWTLVRGSSRRRLPGLLRTLGSIDLFIHDSRHSHRNMAFEMRLAWDALHPGGFLLVDDVHRNTAFAECVQRSRSAPSLVCASEDGKGMFGILQKPRVTLQSVPDTPCPATRR